MLMMFKFIFRKLCPKFIEFFIVFTDVVFAIKNNNIFLIMWARLKSPIEWTCNQKYWINNHKLIVHMIVRSIVSSSRNSTIRHSLSVCTLPLHSFIICNDSNFNSSLMSCKNFICQIIICERKNAKINWFLSQRNIFNKFLYICRIWKEESILISTFRSVKIMLKLLYNLSKPGQHFLIMFALHLLHGNSKCMTHSLVACFFFKSIVAHFSNTSGYIL